MLFVVIKKRMSIKKSKKRELEKKEKIIIFFINLHHTRLHKNSN